MDIEQVKTTEDCDEVASMDTYDESEYIAGWCTCLTDVFDSVESCTHMGQKVQLIKISQQRNSIVAKISFRGEISYTTIDCLRVENLKQYQKIWIKAYKQFLL